MFYDLETNYAIMEVTYTPILQLGNWGTKGFCDLLTIKKEVWVLLLCPHEIP